MNNISSNRSFRLGRIVNISIKSVVSAISSINCTYYCRWYFKQWL